MNLEFPEDLAALQRWADESVEAARNLWSGEGRSIINAARMKLIGLLCNPPSISRGLCRELTIASDGYRGNRRASITRFGNVPAKHPLDAIIELSWQVLERALFQSRTHIQLRLALAREAIRLGAKKPRGFKQWETAVSDLEEVEKDRGKLAINLPRFQNVLGQFPHAARPGFITIMPPPPIVLRPNDDISTLLGIVLNRVWEKRISKAKVSSDSDVSVGSAPEKKKRSRKTAYDKNKDAWTYKQWTERNRRLRTYAQFAEARGIKAEEVKNAIDRHRKRIKPRN